MIPKLIVSGAAGRMGRRIVALAAQSGDFELAGAIDVAEHPDLGKDAALLAGADSMGVVLSTEHPKDADVMIDFSLPTATDNAVEYCVKNGVALVLGTTGLSDAQNAMLAEAAKKIPLIQASNYSVGMNVLFGIVGKVAAKLGGDYDIEITESHHRFKKDSPSGTALSLAEKIADETARDFPGCLVHGREGKDALRTDGTIGMHAIRAGGITGEHSVIYGTLGETVTISHSAHNRDNFVWGALRAAKWLVGKEAGRYSMNDVLGL